MFFHFVLFVFPLFCSRCVLDIGYLGVNPLTSNFFFFSSLFAVGFSFVLSLVLLFLGVRYIGHCALKGLLSQQDQSYFKLANRPYA